MASLNHFHVSHAIVRSGSLFGYLPDEQRSFDTFSDAYALLLADGLALIESLILSLRKLDVASLENLLVISWQDEGEEIARRIAINECCEQH